MLHSATACRSFGNPLYTKARKLDDLAEIELFALGRQCIANSKILDLTTLKSLLKPWAFLRNVAQKGAWQFTSNDARTKLKYLYPVIKI